MKKVAKGKALNFNVGIMNWYKSELHKLIKPMMKECLQEISSVYEENKEDITFSTDASISSQTRIMLSYLEKKYLTLFDDKAKKLAKSMLQKTNRFSLFSLKKSISSISDKITIKGSIIPEALEETIKSSILENVSLIKSIPQEYFKQVTGSVTRSINSGGSLSSLIKDIKKYNGMTEKRAKFISLDQTRKAYNDINLRRMQSTGIKKFEWVHTGGSQNPRSYHQQRYPAGLNGGIFDIDNPPIIDKSTGQTGYPGHLPNCRCRMIPVIDFEDE